MLQQLTPTIAPSAPRTAVIGRGAVLSIDAARRRRMRRPASQDVISVMVVGSHAITRAGLRLLLEDDAGLAVVGEAASADQGARLVRATEPDVVLLDAGSFEPDPVASTRLLAGRVAVLLLTECEADDDRVLAALRAGATGVLAKDSHPAELASAVRTLAGGGALLPPRTGRRLITELVNTTRTLPC
jgi:DNA-binding NarL/FixJ family response regulator